MNFDEFGKHVDKDGFFDVPIQTMDEDQLDIDREKKKIIKAEVGDEIDELDLKEDDKEDYDSYESDIEYTFVPNIKDEQKKQEEIMEDFIYKNEKGTLV